MICELHIENIAVIKQLTVSFGDGFSVLTGETGAGKSIIIDSVNLLLGARSAKELIRSGEERALVSACFSELTANVVKELEALDVYPDEDGCIYVQRTLSSDGKTQSKLNGRSVPNSVLRDAGRLLINIHGQHDNQLLLTPNKHIDFLDSYAVSDGLINEYEKEYSALCEIRKRLKENTRSEKETAELIETLSYRLSEIDGAKLKKGEEEALLAKREKIKNIEKISRYSSEIFRNLSGGDGTTRPACELIREADEAVRKLADILPESDKICQRLSFCAYELQDIAETAAALTDGDFTDPEAELDRIESRLDVIARLESKYAPDIPSILEYREKLANELGSLKNNGATVDSIKREFAAKAKEASACADKLTEHRKAFAEKLSALVTEQLRYLDLEKVTFSVNVAPLVSENGARRFTANGCDEVEFLISTNPGEPLKPLSKIASGGELSRVMLALKSVLADSDGVGTIIFDEIDTGVSGKTSQKIGIKLHSLAKSCQVICITHSAQIAATADTHYKILKTENAGRNETSVSELDRVGRIDELSRIMGGIEITETLRKTAEEMLDTNK